MWTLLGCLLAISSVYASETAFSIQDDVLAYPQFDIVFSESYITEAEATKKLQKLRKILPESSDHQQPLGQLSNYRAPNLRDDHGQSPEDDEKAEEEEYERLLLADRPYLCSLPRIGNGSREEINETSSKLDQERDMATAAERGWELLRDLEGSCMFLVSGWWSFSFCYNSHIKQFHQLPPGSGGSMFPPQEDPSTPSYVLGQFEEMTIDKSRQGSDQSSTTALQVKGKTRYLVQKVGGGTTCDLTGKERRVEVQFHCHPQSTARIGWVKEVATCTYLMVIYHPRLCNDVAFMPARHSEAHMIACREILGSDQTAEWERRKSAEAERSLIGGRLETPLMAGDVEIGAMKEVGRDGRQIQKGSAVTPREERIEIIALRKDGKIERLPKERLQRLGLDPDTAEAVQKEIQALAGDKDWRVEKIVDEQGHAQLRVVVAPGGSEEVGDEDERESNGEEMGEGSEEVY